MQDDGLKRGIHFVCGFLLGAPVCGFLGYGITGSVVKRWGDFQRATEVETALNVSAVPGGLLIGLVAMTQLDSLWSRVVQWMDD